MERVGQKKCVRKRLVSLVGYLIKLARTGLNSSNLLQVRNETPRAQELLPGEKTKQSNLKKTPKNETTPRTVCYIVKYLEKCGVVILFSACFAVSVPLGRRRFIAAAR